MEVLRVLDTLPPGTPVFVGVVDQSVRSHIKKGRFAYIDPRKYDVWTEQADGHRTRARLFMARKEA